MATRIMHATKGATMNASTGPVPAVLLGVGGRRAKPARQLPPPQAHKTEVGLGAGLATGVPRHDDRLGPGACRRLLHLVPVVVGGRQPPLNPLLLHLLDALLHVARGGWDAGLGLDVVHARHVEFAREVVPLLV